MITYVTDELAIGDSQDARYLTQDKFDAALCVAIDLDICDKEIPDVKTYYVRRHKIGLYDGPGNHPLVFASAVLTLEGLISQNKRVLVHCHAGQSRSPMVAAAWVAYKGRTSLEDALEQIMAARKLTIYRQDLYALAQQALAILKKS